MNWPARCIVCGRRIEKSEAGAADHHCSQHATRQHDAALARDDEQDEEPTFGERLAEGFSLLGWD